WVFAGLKFAAFIQVLRNILIEAVDDHDAVITPVDIVPKAAQIISSGVVRAGIQAIVVGGLTCKATGVTHWANDRPTRILHKDRRVHQRKDPTIAIGLLNATHILQSTAESLDLLAGNTNVFAGFLRFFFRQRLFGSTKPPSLCKDVRFPLCSLRGVVLVD